jgi:hypothetical protein
MERDRTGKRMTRTEKDEQRRVGCSRRAVRRNRVLALAILAVLALATIAPAGQASGASQAERAAQRAVQAAERAAQREAAHAQREAERAARHAAKAVVHAERVAKFKVKVERRLARESTPFADLNIGCTSIVIEYHGFTDVAKSPNVITQTVLLKQRPIPGPVAVLTQSPFSFEGTEATVTIPISAPMGPAAVDVRGRFDSNGVKGAFNVNLPLICPPNPAFTIDTLQSTGGPFTSGTLPGTVGQTVTYQTTATNSGNTSLTFGNFSDPGCDGVEAGGSSAPIAPRDSVTFICTHTLTEADRQAGMFADAASVTGTPEVAYGLPKTQSSAGVLVTPIAPGEAKAKTPASGGEVTTAAVPAVAGPGTGKSSVLSFSSARIPSLLGPARCVRGLFTASVRSSGVASVTFYIDGHKLARRTAHSAVKGLISIHFNGAKLKAGTHRLTASITMLPGSPTAKAVVGSRARIVRRCAVVKHA